MTWSWSVSAVIDVDVCMVWSWLVRYPGKANEGRMFGTVRTLDNAKGVISLDCDTLPPYQQYGRPAQLCTYGVVSRSGWVMVDDSVRPRLDNDPVWPWVMDPPSLPQVTAAGA